MSREYLRPERLVSVRHVDGLCIAAIGAGVGPVGFGAGGSVFLGIGGT